MDNGVARYEYIGAIVEAVPGLFPREGHCHVAAQEIADYVPSWDCGHSSLPTCL